MLKKLNKSVPILMVLLVCLTGMAVMADPPATGEAATDPSDVPDLQTFSTAGKELRPFTGGVEAELLNHQGRGCLTHMWFGGQFPGYEKTRIRVFIDGETDPSIDMELGLGVGVGFNDPASPWGVARMGLTGYPSGIYNTFHIPFGKNIRVTAQLGKGVKGNPLFWWILRGTDNLPVTLGGVRLPDAARLHLYKLEDYLAKPLEEFDLCKTTKSGELYLVTMAAKSTLNLNFMEAQMRAYVGGSDTPMFLSSGLEDYFLGTYYFKNGRYQNAVAGLTHLDKKDFSFSAYRFHEDDPFFFRKGLRLTCRCGEKSGDHVYWNPQPTTYTTYAWVYEW